MSIEDFIEIHSTLRSILTFFLYSLLFWWFVFSFLTSISGLRCVSNIFSINNIAENANESLLSCLIRLSAGLFTYIHIQIDKYMPKWNSEEKWCASVENALAYSTDEMMKKEHSERDTHTHTNTHLHNKKDTLRICFIEFFFGVKLQILR